MSLKIEVKIDVFDCNLESPEGCRRLLYAMNTDTEFVITPRVSWSGCIWYIVQCGRRYLHRDFHTKRLVLIDAPYTFACREHAEAAIEQYKKENHEST
jgi:hypothetical protein